MTRRTGQRSESGDRLPFLLPALHKQRIFEIHRSETIAIFILFMAELYGV